MSGDRSVGAALAALLALGLLGGAFTLSWFDYEFNSGRKVAPEGPYSDNVTGIEARTLSFYASGSEGDAAPVDDEAARLGAQVLLWGLRISAGLLILAVLAEVPGVSRVLRRPVALALYGVVLVGLAGVLLATWVLLPAAMGEHGIGAPFTSRLEEPGYTWTSLGWGWAAGALAWAAAFGAALWKFQAGDVDPRQVEAHRAE